MREGKPLKKSLSLMFIHCTISYTLPFKHQPHKMVKHTQFFGNSRQVIWVRLTFLWGWHLKCWTGVVSPNTIAIKSNSGLCEVKMAKVFLKLVSLERISAKEGDEAKEQFSEVNLRSCNSSRRKVPEFLHVYTEMDIFYGESSIQLFKKCLWSFSPCFMVSQLYVDSVLMRICLLIISLTIL